MSAPLATYRSRPRLTALLTVFTVTAMLAGALASSRAGTGGTMWFISGAAFGIAAATSASVMWLVSGRKLVMFDDGFTIETHLSSVTARWEHVDSFLAPPASVTRTPLRRMTGRYEYRLVVGDTVIDLGLPLGADDRLGDLIDERTRPLLHSKWASRLASGRRMPAGPVTLSAHGLQIGSIRKRTVAFNDIESLGLRRGRLEIHRSSRKAPTRIPIARIPNVRTLVDLIDRRHDWLPETPGSEPAEARTRSWG